MKHMPAPCPACPWRKDVTPGALGGSPTTTYIGQVFGPYVLPCHQACDFDDPQWREKALDQTPQCAGAAIFRTHVGVSDRLPEQLHSLPANPLVFESPVAFVAHHDQLTMGQAGMKLRMAGGINELVLRQLRRPTNITRRM